MDSFEFITRIRNGNARVRCEYYYNGDIRVEIIGVEWAFSEDQEIDCTQDEMFHLEYLAYKELKLINQEELI